MHDPACGAGYHVPSDPAGPPARHPGARIDAARFALERFGVGLRPSRASLWLHGESVAAFDGVAGLVRDVMGGRADVALVLTSRDPATVAALRPRFPDDVVMAAPRASFGSVGRFLARQRPNALVLLDGVQALDPAVVASVRTSSLPVCAVDDARAEPAARRVVVDALRALVPSAPDAGATDRSWQVPTLRDRAGQSAAWRFLAPLLARRRIADWERLRERLGRPRAVMCLGNGPSSEDPRLATMAHDCLIRSNWRWRERGFLARPDVVFVGDPATLHKVPPCVFAFWSVRLEHGMLLRHLVTHGWRAMEYFTVERLSPLAGEGRWPARPSNGALSIVAAAALAPERLVIAGIDLFEHPEGRYPGARGARNEYSPAHTIHTDLALIDLALRDFAGEVVIVGDILRERLGRFREGARDAA